MKNYNDVAIEGSKYEIGLTKIIDKKIKEVRGYLSNDFGDLVFKMSKIELEDGTFLGCEGEHDIPYLVEYGDKTPENYNEEVLENIEKTDPDYVEDEE